MDNKKKLVVIGILAISYFITGKLSFFLSFSNKIVVMSIFFPEGISLAFAIIFGYFVFWGVFIGQFILAISSGLSLLPSFLISAINSVEVVIAYYLLVKTGAIRKLTTVKELYILFGAIFFVLQPLSALLGNLTLMLAGIIQKEQFFNSLISWYMGNTIAQTLLTPALVYMYFNERKVSLQKLIISAMAGIFVGFTLFFILKIKYFSLLLGITLTISLVFATFFDVFYTGIYLVFLYIAVLTSFKFGNFHFFTKDITENLVNINFYFFSHVFIVYTYSFLIKEKEEYMKQLENLNLSLEERIKKAVEKNQKQQELLHKQAKFAQMGELLSMMAHQWKQPLNTISLIIQRTYVKNQLGKLTKEDIEKCFNETQEKINGMAEVLHNFSELFKPKSGKQTVFLNDLIKKTVNILETSLNEEGIKVVLDVDTNIALETYPKELSQILLSIITNAKEALERSDKKEKVIKVSARKTSDNVEISIEDNGGGIPEDTIEKIFDPYFSTKSNVERGLGLYTTKILVENHLNGEIYVKNTKEGAKFTIHLHLKEGEYARHSSGD